ncbi:hypothetical protein GCM10029978_033060 [Actinoallomurus acanthiterrae]
MLRLSVSNNGARPTASRPGGSGPANRRARSREAGGALAVRREGDRFILVAELPVDEVPAAA